MSEADTTSPTRRWLQNAIGTLVIASPVVGIFFWLGGLDWLISLLMRLQGIIC